MATIALKLLAAYNATAEKANIRETLNTDSHATDQASGERK